MASVQLQVNVARGQLDTLIADVNKLNNQEIKLNVGKGGTESVKRYSSSVKQASKDTKELTGLSKILGDSLGNIAAKIVAWQVINGAVATMIRSFKDAVSTMKAVDDELVTVRKVTGATAAEMKRIEKQAYATASAYGVAADEYLESVAAFARAGYGDQAEALAELSTKTQIVGDTTAEVANQFLLAVDAAYQYKGNIESLTKVLDGANEIDNHYATSIEKIAEGLGKVAPIAAQTHVGINELTAAIGTITAVTQRSGTEAATALRALLLNIVGDTKTEIEEGVTWTTGEIAGLTDVIKKYAPAAYEAAQATGEVIDPMEAIGGLAQSMKDGLLTEQELMSMVSDIGGKLRTSQLLALIQNWDMYKSMLEDFGNAAGSADAEVSNALDSWTRKTMQLKNTWTEFLTNFINSETVKGGLDILIAAVDSLNGGFGEFAATTVIVFGVLKMLPAALTMISSGFTFVSNAAYIMQASFYGISDSAIAASLGMTEAEVAATRLNATLGIVALAIGAVIYAFNSQKKAAEEARQYTIDTADDSLAAYKNIQELKSAYETAAEGSDAAVQAANDLTAALEGQGFAVDNLKQKYVDLTEKQKEYALNEQKAKLHALGEQIEEGVSGFDSGILLRAREILSEGELLDEFLSGFGGFGMGIANLFGATASDIDAFNFSIDGLLRMYDYAVERIGELSPDSQEYSDLAAFIQLLKEQGIEAYMDTASVIDELSGKTQRYTESAIAYAQTIIRGSQVAGDSAKEIHNYGEAIAEAAGKTDEASKEKIASALESIETLTAAMVENGEISQEVADEIVDYYNQVAQIENPTYAAAAASGDLISALVDESGQLTDTAVQALSTDSALLAVAMAETQVQAAAARANYSNLINQLGAVASAAIDAASKLAMVGMGNAKIMLADAMKADAAANRPSWMPPSSNILNKFNNSASSYPAADAIIENAAGEIINDLNYAESQVKYWDNYSKQLEDIKSGKGSGGGGGGLRGGGGGGSAEDRFLAALEDEIDLLKSELALMRERGASEEDQIKKIQQIQKALKAEADYLKEIGASQTEINKLEKEWWSYQDEIYDIRLDLLKSELALMEEREDDTETQIAKAREIQAVLREQIDSLKEIGASQTEINKLEKEWWELENEIADKTNQLAEDRLSLEEKILAVQEAQVALMNAQNERTVRMYNAATGQWEWTANPKDLQSAQEALDSANQDLSDFYNDHKELQPEADEMGASELLAGMALTVPDEMIPEIIGTGGTSAPATAKKLQEIFTSAGAAKAMVMQSNIGTQNNGNVYYFGGISFTEAQAESMTLKQLAEQSRILNIYSGAN